MGQKTETKKPDPEGVYWIHIELDVKGKSKRSCSRIAKGIAQEIRKQPHIKDVALIPDEKLMNMIGRAIYGAYSDGRKAAR